MKILIIIFLLCAPLVWADKPIVEFAYELEAGLLPLNNWMLHTTWTTEKFDEFYIDLKAEIILFELLFVGGSNRTVMSTRGEIFGFNPGEQWYGFHFGIRYGGFELGFRHFCFHPVMTYIGFNGMGTVNAEGAYEEIYFKFSGKVTIF